MELAWIKNYIAFQSTTIHFTNFNPNTLHIINKKFTVSL